MCPSARAPCRHLPPGAPDRRARAPRRRRRRHRPTTTRRRSATRPTLAPTSTPAAITTEVAITEPATIALGAAPRARTCTHQGRRRSAAARWSWTNAASAAAITPTEATRTASRAVPRRAASASSTPPSPSRTAGDPNAAVGVVLASVVRTARSTASTFDMSMRAGSRSRRSSTRSAAWPPSVASTTGSWASGTAACTVRSAPSPVSSTITRWRRSSPNQNGSAGSSSSSSEATRITKGSGSESNPRNNGSSVVGVTSSSEPTCQPSSSAAPVDSDTSTTATPSIGSVRVGSAPSTSDECDSTPGCTRSTTVVGEAVGSPSTARTVRRGASSTSRGST